MPAVGVGVYNGAVTSMCLVLHALSSEGQRVSCPSRQQLAACPLQHL